MKRVGKFTIIGAILTIFNFIVYTIIARVIINDNELLWIDSIISYCLATILAYILHSKVTWKERTPSKSGVINFFIWNGITGLAISPLLTWLFGSITPIYKLAFDFSSIIHLPFDYNFIESTGIFVFTTCITMILNYLFYDKFVFDDTYIKKIHLPTKNQVFSIILYLMPVIFAISTTFLITTSCEDNFQGAGNFRNGVEINVINDAANAFQFNSRITDMYAWSIIDFYDYQFQFGPDTILRLIDATAIILVFYLATYLTLNRKPKLLIKDSLIFCAVFAVFIITPFGRAFYHEFSMIHNYVPLAIITMLFSIPYLKLLTNSTANRRPLLLTILMLFAGLYFGMSATITPLAFLATVILFCIIKRKTLHIPPLWFFSGIIGTITGFLICWFAGSGIDHYTDANAAVFDYLPLNEIFSDIPKLLFHEAYNFGLVILPLVAIFIICLIFAKYPRKILTKKFWQHLSPTTKNLLLVFFTFITIHILGASLVKAPPRILIPAYLAGIIIIFRLFTPYLHTKILSTSVVILTTITVLVHLILLVKYRFEMSIILNNIKASDEFTICINPSTTAPSRIPIIDLSQANIVENWNLPEPIYGKGIIGCE